MAASLVHALRAEGPLCQVSAGVSGWSIRYPFPRAPFADTSADSTGGGPYEFRASRTIFPSGVVRPDTTGTRTIVEHARSRFPGPELVLISNAKMGKSTGRRGRE
jgi:hypothetical protein